MTDGLIAKARELDSNLRNSCGDIGDEAADTLRALADELELARAVVEATAAWYDADDDDASEIIVALNAYKAWRRVRRWAPR